MYVTKIHIFIYFIYCYFTVLFDALLRKFEPVGEHPCTMPTKIKPCYSIRRPSQIFYDRYNNKKMQSNEVFVISIAVTILFGIILLSFLKDTKGTTGTVIKSILLLCVVAVILYILYVIYEKYNQAKKDSPVLVDHPMVLPGKQSQHIVSPSRIGNEYTVSFWIYVSNWDVNYGHPKHILSRTTRFGVNPGIWLYPNKSNLMIRVDTNNKGNKNYAALSNCKEPVGAAKLSGSATRSTIIGGDPRDCENACTATSGCTSYAVNRKTNQCTLMGRQSVGSSSSFADITANEHLTKGNVCLASDPNSVVYVKHPTSQYGSYTSDQINSNDQCDVVDLGIQRWVHVAVVLWNRTLDVYKNGKLVRSCILDGVVPLDPTSSVKIGGDDEYTATKGGHWGAVSHVQYFNHSLNAKQIYRYYRRGPDNWSLLQDFKNMFPKVEVSGNLMSYSY